MKSIMILLALFFLASPLGFAREQTILARVTVYWHGQGQQQRACSNGAKLREGHCAVDPNKIPYGSKVIFDDRACVAVDSGPAVVSRKAARLSGRTATQRNALVIDRYFESKKEALAWANAHPHFLQVQVLPPGTEVLPAADHKLTDLVEPNDASEKANIGISPSNWTSLKIALSHALGLIVPLASDGALLVSE